MIRFDLPEIAQVEMNVYDINGRRVRQLLAVTLPAASHRLNWNGQDDNGRQVNSGIYFLVLRAQPSRSSATMVGRQKLVLVRP
jgi:flagellar hook assembly protein FlgD